MLGSSGSSPRPSRTLSPAEVQVIRSLLASRPISERERILEAQLPPRTYHAARSRILEEGWVLDRYLPDLGLVGLPYVHFAIGQPFEEGVRGVTDRWGADPTNVLLWTSPQTIFGVFIDASRTWNGPGGLGLGPETGLRQGAGLTVDSREFSIPVYFDFEGAIGRMAGHTSALAYPQSWFCRGSNGDGRGGSAHPGNPGGARGNGFPTVPLSAVAGIVRRPFEVLQRGESPMRVGPHFAPRSQQRALERGWATRRLFLDPLVLPALQGHRMDRLVLARGELLAQTRPTGLYHRLLADCHVSPFLFSTDWRSVLIGFVAPSAPREAAPTPSGRPSVSATLQSFLRKIEVYREPTASLVSTVNHRYDRLFPLAGPLSPPAGGGPRR